MLATEAPREAATEAAREAAREAATWQHQPRWRRCAMSGDTTRAAARGRSRRGAVRRLCSAFDGWARTGAYEAGLLAMLQGAGGPPPQADG
eukprot:7080776-Prymnesium_polylepis.1